MKQNYRHLYLFILLIFALTTITRVLPAGFHPDSLVYMSMARNLADGQYGFLDLHFTNHIFNHFYEHPPLGIYSMSLFFYIFGDTILIDKLFGVFFGLLIMIEIVAIYRLVDPKDTKSGMLLALFYFMLFPITSYTLENNLLEIPTTFFTLASVYFFLKGLLCKENSILYILLFTAMLTAGFFVKGPVALFPLALPFFYFLLFSKEYSFKNLITFYLFLLIFITILIVLIYNYAPAYNYFSIYFENQVLSSINGSRGGDKHFQLISQLGIDLSAIVFVSIIIMFIGKIKFETLKTSRMFWLFLLIGLSASLPLEISPRQHSYYIFPSLPYFAIALSLLFANSIKQVVHKFGSYKLIKSLNFLLIIALIGISYVKIDEYKRHKNFYKDFIEANVNLEQNATIFACSNNADDKYNFFNNTELSGNLQRYYKASLIENNINELYYLTTTRSHVDCKVDSEKYKYIGPVKASYYLLYKRI